MKLEHSEELSSYENVVKELTDSLEEIENEKAGTIEELDRAKVAIEGLKNRMDEQQALATINAAKELQKFVELASEFKAVSSECTDLKIKVAALEAKLS
jgi:predicted nuclease with TOPRIM domain